MKQYILAQPQTGLGFFQNIDLISRAGFDGVFVTLNDGFISDKQIEYIYQKNLEVETLHLPYHHPFNIIDSLWKCDSSTNQALKVVFDGISLAKRNNIDTVVLHASSGYSPIISDDVINNYRKIAEFCEKNDITLALENIKCVKSLATLLNHLDNTKMCFDIGHANAFTKNLESEIWYSLFKKMHCVHLHDNMGNDDSHMFPGMGNINFELKLKELIHWLPRKKITWELYYKKVHSCCAEVNPNNFFEKAYESINKVMISEQN